MTLNITADDAAGLIDEFRRLNDLTTPVFASAETVIEALSLNDFMDIANAKLRPQGFKIVVDEPEPEPELASKVTPTVEPATASERAARAKKTKAEAESPSNNVEEFPAPRRAKKPEIDNLKAIAEEAGDTESDP